MEIRINIGVSNVYMFLHADSEGVQFYNARRYVQLKKEETEEDFFVSDEEEEESEVLPASESPLLLEQKVCGVKISYLPYLASGHNFNLSSEISHILRTKVQIMP